MAHGKDETTNHKSHFYFIFFQFFSHLPNLPHHPRSLAPVPCSPLPKSRRLVADILSFRLVQSQFSAVILPWVELSPLSKAPNLPRPPSPTVSKATTPRPSGAYMYTNLETTPMVAPALARIVSFSQYLPLHLPQIAFKPYHKSDFTLSLPRSQSLFQNSWCPIRHRAPRWRSRELQNRCPREFRRHHHRQANQIDRARKRLRRTFSVHANAPRSIFHH